MDRPGIPSVCLMLITALDQDTGDPIYHYCYIKSLSRLLRQQYYDTKRHFCTRCLQGYTTEGLLEKHRTLCRGAASRPTRIDMPKKGKNILQFTNYQKQMKAPFVIYADSESILAFLHLFFPDLVLQSSPGAVCDPFGIVRNLFDIFQGQGHVVFFSSRAAWALSPERAFAR